MGRGLAGAHGAWDFQPGFSLCPGLCSLRRHQKGFLLRALVRELEGFLLLQAELAGVTSPDRLSPWLCSSPVGRTGPTWAPRPGLAVGGQQQPGLRGKRLAFAER